MGDALHEAEVGEHHPDRAVRRRGAEHGLRLQVLVDQEQTVEIDLRTLAYPERPGSG